MAISAWSTGRSTSAGHGRNANVEIRLRIYARRFLSESKIRSDGCADFVYPKSSRCAGVAQIVEAVLQGAVDYLVWPFDVAAITESIELTQSRAAALAGSKLREAMARSRIERLTRREREVLAGVADGMSNRMIGEKLEISPRTVEIHRANMLNKMGANHTSEAIRIAIEAALIN